METSEKPEKKAGRLRSALWEWAVALIIALVVAVLLTQVVFVNAQIPSESMEKTIMVGDRVVGLRLSYLFDPPQRVDIIIFRFPDDPNQLYVKRVIGLPGETVEVIDGATYIDGEPMPEVDAHVNGTPVGDYGPWTVPEDGYFVMGDNRNLSYDSRFWHNTFVTRDAVIGRAAVRVFPNPGVLK